MNADMHDESDEQQPIQRTIGRRQRPPVGVMPSAAARAALNQLANYRTRAPKGIFFYSNHEEMTRDRERWTVEAIVAHELAQRERAT